MTNNYERITPLIFFLSFVPQRAQPPVREYAVVRQ
jgi:hypothetical protein